MTLFEYTVVVALLGILGMTVVGSGQTLSRYRLYDEAARVAGELHYQRIHSVLTQKEFVAQAGAPGTEAYSYWRSGRIGFTQKGTAKYSGTLFFSHGDAVARITQGVGFTPTRLYLGQ